MGNSTRLSPLGQRASSPLQSQANKKEKREEDGAGVRLTSKKSKSKPNKHSPSRELNGTEIMFYNSLYSTLKNVNIFENLFHLFTLLGKIKIKCISCTFCTGSKGTLKLTSMITISESDNWEISSCSGMKYGQFVDWEKIDPEAAQRYQQILESDHQQLKTMGREGFWAMPHTLRAKAYYHIIHGINSR